MSAPHATQHNSRAHIGPNPTRANAAESVVPPKPMAGSAAQHLRFARNGTVFLNGFRIGFVEESKRTGPKGGEFSVYNWRPNISCPPHLLGPIHQSTRMRQIHGELRTLHYQPKPWRPIQSTA